VKQIILWRWDEPTLRFIPEKNWYGKELNRPLKSHNEIVYAGLTPDHWKKLKGNHGKVLHRIRITKNQAKLCVVAEGFFRPNTQELDKFVKENGGDSVGSLTTYEDAHYEDSFVPLLEYNGGYNLPEVLIPFPVDAKICSIPKRVKMYMHLLYKRITPSKLVK